VRLGFSGCTANALRMFTPGCGGARRHSRVDPEKELAASLRVYPDPDTAKSVLYDLPVTKPRNTSIVDDMGIPNLQLKGPRTPKITFPIFALEND
jgi:hypothetical protein